MSVSVPIPIVVPVVLKFILVPILSLNVIVFVPSIAILPWNVNVPPVNVSLISDLKNCVESKPSNVSASRPEPGPSLPACQTTLPLTYMST